MRFRVCLLALITLAMASFILLNFAMILAYGSFYIYESNKYILFLEISMFISILGFSFYCLREQIQGDKER
jgi:hypothetical protein